MEHSLTKATAFKKRTFWLLTPGIVAPALLNSTSFPGFGNLVSLTVGGPESEFRTAPLLAKFLHNRNSANESVKNYGSLSIFENEDKKYLIENPSPFDDSIFGAEFSFKKGNIEEGSGSDPNTPPKPATQQKEDALVDKNLKFVKSSTPKPNKPGSKDEDIASYSFSKDSFNSSLKGKSDLNLIVDLEIDLSGNKKMFSTSAIPLNQFVFDNQSTIPLLKVKDQDSNPISDYVLEVKKEQSTSLEMNIKKVTPTKPAGSRQKRSAPAEPTNPITTLKVRNFFVIFSDNPPVSFENMFENIQEQAGVVFQGSGTSFRKFFLENWKKKGSGDGKGNQAEFEFTMSNSSWKSMCADPYKVGGFIESSSAPKPASSKPAVAKGKSTQNAGQYIKDQKSNVEDFNPRDYAKKLNDAITDSSARKHTKAMPCEGMDETTKNNLKADQSLMPKSLKDKVSDTSESATSTKQSKIIPGSFRAWHDGNLFNSFYEEALTTSHYFDAKITKEHLKSKLLKHEKLTTATEGNKAAPNTIPEVSTQLQVAIPYTFFIYDHDSKFLKVQRINLNIDLDLKALYNQSQFTKDFFTYDLSKHHSKISGESDSEYGLSGTITFSAGLFLDVDKNLNVRLITTTKGFVSTKKGTGNNVDLRDRSNQSTSNPTIPFIVIDVDQDPRISSFYVDRRVGNAGTTTSTAPAASGRKDSGSQQPKTLSDLEKNLDQKPIKQIKKFDYYNNAEVFFFEVGAEEEMRRKNNDLKALGEARVNYSNPRRNSGSISIETENLDKITLSLSGSSTLGNKYFNSIFSLAKATVCATEPTSASQQKQTYECAYGDNKYQTQIKDLGVGDIDSKIGLRQIQVNWSDIKDKKEESSAKEYEFLQVVSYYNPSDKKGDATQPTWDNLESKFGNIFKETSSKTTSSSSSDFPSASFAAVWYSVKLWYDETNKNLQYQTILRPITAIKYGSRGLFSWASSEYIDNSNSHQVAGSAARAGFQLGQIELEYKKTS